MRTLAVMEWVTLDGVYDADTMPQWFEPYDSPDRQQWIRDAILGADGFLVGRVTYEMLAEYWPKVTDRADPRIELADKLNSAPKYVVSSTLKKASWNASTILRGDIGPEVGALKRSAGRTILVTGSGTLLESLTRAGLVDELRVLVHPVLLGRGKRAFRDGLAMTRLKLVGSETSSRGVTLLRYQRVERS